MKNKKKSTTYKVAGFVNKKVVKELTLLKSLQRKKEKYWCSVCGAVVEKWTYYWVNTETNAIIKYHDSACLPVDERLEMPKIHRCLHKKKKA